jgi:GNAT superfamily N-acetyltransferase
MDRRMMTDGGAVVVRPYRPGDRAAVREICVATAWHGGPAPERIGDEWLWAEFWTRYFTDVEPEHTWVAETVAGPRDEGSGVRARRQARRPDATDCAGDASVAPGDGAGAVVGYLAGTVDAARVERYFWRLLPGIVGHVVRRHLLWRRTPRRALVGMVGALLRNELAVPKEVLRTCPATFHFNLRPAARGQGVGQRLFAEFVAAMRRAGVPGIHAQSLSSNKGVARFNRRAGFELVATRALREFGADGTTPQAVYTWAQRLEATAGGEWRMAKSE